METTTTLGLGPSPGPSHVHHRPPRGGVNWQTVAAVIAAILALMAWSGVPSPRSVQDLQSRVTVLETNRTNDNQRLDRIETKVDEVLTLQRERK